MDHRRNTPAGRKTPWTLLALLAAPPVLLALLWLWSSGSAQSVTPREPSKTGSKLSSSEVPSTREAPNRVVPLRKVDPVTPPDALPAPVAGAVCWQGDVYDVDGRGGRLGRRADCGSQRCVQGACLTPDPAGCTLPETGVCVGDAVEICHAGRRRRVVCPNGERCAVGAEGAGCVPRTEDDCDWFGGVCEGDELVRCVEGRLLRTDCANQAAGRCVESDTARCVQVAFVEPEQLEPTCGGCGCEPSAEPFAEVCDGVDNDGNGFIDDGVFCEPVPVVAFLVAGRGGGSYTEADIELELARVNAVFAGSDAELPVQFVLDEVRVIDRADYLELSEGEFDDIIRARGVYLDRDDFYVPIVFTDEVLIGGAPKLGVATLPNGRCGRRRRDGRAQVPLGLIAVSKARSATTVAHEIGHFLGLCHTHEPEGDVPVPVVAAPGADTGKACPVCSTDGDGMCDTPRDPGPPTCAYSLACAVSCEEEAAAPDAFNLMSYYTSCRGQLTLEQQAEVRRNIALRRAWAPCLDGTCACEPGSAACPVEMSCRPGAEGAGRCALHGGVLGGEPCRGEGDCVAGHLCAAVGGDALRCRPVCGSDAGGCDCQPVAPGWAVCR